MPHPCTDSGPKRSTHLPAPQAALLLFFCAGGLSTVWGHSMYQAAVLLDFHDHAIEAELQLPVERLQAAMGMPITAQSIEQERARIAGYILHGLSAARPDGQSFAVEVSAPITLSNVEGSPYVVARLRLTPPNRLTAELFNLHCDVLLDRVPSQVILVSIRTDWRTSTFANEPRLLGVLRGDSRSVRVDRREESWWRGFGSVFQLGMRHIAEGTDHLLFLLALLLPAPLIVWHSRWAGYAGIRQCLWKIGQVVTAFTAGHSVTLAAGATNLVHVPSRPIEVFIACSIMVSAAHALRPIFPGREAVIAACFGLVHGLAFATALAELGLGPWERAAGILGFNLGIESMQLIVVAAALPSLILLSRTRLYGVVRIGGALFAAIAAGGWIAQRLWNIPNPLDALVTALAQSAAWIAAALTILGAIARNLPRLRGNTFSPATAEESNR